MRTIHCGDALAFLANKDAMNDASCVTSLPDISELEGSDLESWSAWFCGVATTIMERVPPDGVAIFYQTDVFRFGRWIDKSAILFRAAHAATSHLLWHKIVCRVPVGAVSEGRPGYAHMLCFSRELTHARTAPTADVIADVGSKDWSRAMGRNACLVACTWIRDNTRTKTVVDPFCGTGTVLAVANDLGLNAVGVEIDKDRATRAETRR